MSSQDQNQIALNFRGLNGKTTTLHLSTHEKLQAVMTEYAKEVGKKDASEIYFSYMGKELKPEDGAEEIVGMVKGVERTSRMKDGDFIEATWDS